jgi:NAD(P)-dependent dehydrogenase (short-subunit alcohol dehydrogenase family)
MTVGTLDGQVALVTGGSSGIGAETCVRLAREGAAVAVNGTGEDGVREVVQRIEQAGGRALGVVGDVSRPEEVADMVRRTVDGLGGLHLVVNNAGMQREEPSLEVTFDSWRAQLAVDLDGPFLVATEAGRHLAAHGGGVVVNVTSVHEHQPRPGYAAYCVAKAGLGMLTQVLAREWAPLGIRVVSVAPGAIATPMQGEQDEQERREQRAGIPAARLGRPEEVAGLIAWLCSPEAAYVSGASVVIDGALMQQVSDS